MAESGVVTLKKLQPILLAVDIERSGDDPIHNATVAIGVCVMHCGKVLAKKRWNGYTDDVHFEPRCYREFWFNRTHLLKAFETAGTHHETQLQITKGFQAFRAEWEKRAAEMGTDMVLVSDCVEYDMYHLNIMINRFTDDPPLPYSATPAEKHDFLRCWSSDSLCRGLLTKIDPEFTGSWGVNTRLRKLLGVQGPECTHLPEDDAHSHAFDASLALGYI